MELMWARFLWGLNDMGLGNFMLNALFYTKYGIYDPSWDCHLVSGSVRNFHHFHLRRGKQWAQYFSFRLPKCDKCKCRYYDDALITIILVGNVNRQDICSPFFITYYLLHLLVDVLCKNCIANIAEWVPMANKVHLISQCQPYWICTICAMCFLCAL